MDRGVSPTLRLWQLAELLRGHRERAELTIEEAVTRLRPHSPRWSRSKLQRVETRLYAPQPAEVEHLAAVYEVPADETATLVQMAREAREKGDRYLCFGRQHFVLPSVSIYGIEYGHALRPAAAARHKPGITVLIVLTS